MLNSPYDRGHLRFQYHNIAEIWLKLVLNTNQSILDFQMTQKIKNCKGPYNDYLCADWVQSNLQFSEKNYFYIFPSGFILNYALQWQPSWISFQHNIKMFYF